VGQSVSSLLGRYQLKPTNLPSPTAFSLTR
jgi:hypothetical protein